MGLDPIRWLLWAAAPVALLPAAYLFALTALSRRGRPPASPLPRLRFDLIVPAHDEETGIADTVRSLVAVDYPADLRRVVVVADNCGDATAERARAAGARVLVRDEPARRGKGYALALAFARSMDDGFADAVVVVDADTVVTPNLLRGLSARLEAGGVAVQARYAVSNPEASWRTCLMAIAFAAFHDVRSLGRERLGLSAGLRGNGMCFAIRLLREVPHDAFSIVEDLEYGIRLGLAGHRVHYADEVVVRGVMVGSADASRSQRRRWEGGRFAMARAHAGVLLRAALARRDRVLADLALDLLVPPLSFVAAAAAVGLAAACAVGGRTAWPWAASTLFLGAHLVRAWWLSGTGLSGVASLARVPGYILWKIGIALSRRDRPRGEWVRTTREQPGPHVTPE